MKRFQFICDGCNVATSIDLSPGIAGDFMPDGWVTHFVVAQENGAAAYEISADLCPECTVKYRHAVNPANWPKLEAEVMKFRKQR